MNEIEKTWNEEVREKKRAASGVHGKKGKRGYVGTMRTPVDLLNGKEKKAYTQSSPVTTSNIYYDQIMSLDEFKALSRQKKMLVLDAYKQRYKVSELADKWCLSKASVYNYFKSYLKNPPADVEQVEQASQPVTVEQSAKEEKHQKKCSFTLMGDFEAQSLGKKLNGLAFMLDDKLKYQVEIHVKELAE